MRFTADGAAWRAACPPDRHPRGRWSATWAAATGCAATASCGAALRVRGRPRRRLRRARAAAAGAGAVMTAQPDAGRLEVRLLRRLPAVAARLRGRAARRSPSRSTSPTSRRRPAPCVAGPYDISLVEGSITTADDAERIQRGARSLAAARHDRRLRDRRRHPGAAQLRRRRRSSSRSSTPIPAYVATLGDSTPIAAHVTVDFELRGCPIDRRQLLEVIAALLHGRTPQRPAHSVCVECKRRGNVCVVVADGTPCLGPVTHAGCGALCPSYNRGCYGCFGPAEHPEHGARSAARLRRARHARGRRGARVPDLQRRRPSRSARRASRTSTSGGDVTQADLRRQVLSVEALARVEGEGAMHVRIRDGEVVDVQLRIYEPPRFFEAFLRGRAYTEPPDITARICGICPVAYQMSACPAIEDACGVDRPRGDPRPAPTALLRRVDREPRAAHLPAARARTSSATRAPSSWPGTTASSWSAACA